MGRTNLGAKELCDGSQTTLHSHAGGGGDGIFTVSGAEVFNGLSPTSWTTLDLSGIVGSNSALVLLKISAASDMDAVAVRTNEDTSEYWNATADASAYGMALGHHDSVAVLVLMVVTDTNGVIEWKTEKSSTATINIISYIKSGVGVVGLQALDGGKADEAYTVAISPLNGGNAGSF